MDCFTPVLISCIGACGGFHPEESNVSLFIRLCCTTSNLDDRGKILRRLLKDTKGGLFVPLYSRESKL